MKRVIGTSCIVTLIVLPFPTARALAAAPVTFTSLNAGDWGVAGTWNAVPPGDHAFPVAGDTANVGHNVFLSADQATSAMNFNAVSLGLNGHTLTLDGMSSWNVGSFAGGTLNQQGTLSFSGALHRVLNQATLDNSGTMTLSGTGNLQISTGSVVRNGSGMGSTALMDITSDLDITPGAGGMGSAPLLDNSGTLRKSAGGGVTTVSTEITNQNGGVIESLSGTLQLAGPTLTNTGGTVLANGGTVQFAGGINVIGGTLDRIGGSLFDLSNISVTFTGPTNAGYMRVNPNTSATVGGGSIINNGTIELGANIGATPTFRIGGDFTLSGSGDLFMSDSAATLDSSGAARLTNSAGHLIHGRGNLSALLSNDGEVRADAGAAGSLRLFGPPKTNTGTITAAMASQVSVETPIDNTGGTLFAADGGDLLIVGTGKATGGTLNSTGTGAVRCNNAGIADVHNLGLFRVIPNTTCAVTGTQVQNDGTLEVGASANASATLRFDADVTLSGTGSLFLSDSNAFLSTGGSTRLTVSAPQDIHGRGNIQAALDNAGVIRADTGQLILHTNAKNNTGTIAAESGQTLRIDSALNNTGGLIVARDASLVYFNGGGANVHGGTLDTEGSGVVQGANCNIADVTNQGLLRVQPNTSINVTGSTLTNNGTIDVGASANASATLQFSADVALAGTGDIFLSDSNAFLSTAGPARLTIPATQDIHGRGNVQAALDNAGIIRAETGLLALHTNAKNNTGTVAAESGQTLRIDTTINNQGGLIVARIGSLVQLNGGAAFVQNGTLNTEGSGLVQGANCNIADVTNQGLLRVQPNTTINVTGSTFTNNGTIDVGASAVASATLQFSSDVALAGTGDIFLSDSNAFLSTAGAVRLTVPATQNIHGRGNVQATLDNAGTIRAETGQLIMHTNAKNNTGTIAAESGQTLRIDTAINNAGGLIVARDTSLVQLNGGAAFVQGGTLDTAGSGVVQGANCSIADVTNQGLLRVQPSTTINVGGTTLTNNGTIDIGASANASGTLQFASSVNVTGSGVFLLSDSNAFLSSIQGVLPIFGPNLLIHGRANLTTSGLNLGSIVGDHPGQILIINPSVSPGLFNGGLIHVSGPQNMTINSASNFTNLGNVQIDAGRTLTVNNGPYRAVGGNTMVAGHLQANGGVSLLGGILSGAGTVTGNVNNDGGAVAPGTSAGTLSVTGAYAQSAAGELHIEIGGANPGEFDKLVMTGVADLCGGTLVIDVINGFVPTPGQTFVVLAAPTLQGAFDSVVQDCSSGSLFNVTINPNNVTLTAAAGSCANRIVSSIAPNGSIDARKATNLDGTGSFGPSSIALTFASAPGALVAADFAVTASNGTAPTISMVSVAGNVATITFTGIIPQNSWITVRHLASNTAATIGFRPGDVNADGATNTVDPTTLSLGLGGHWQPALSQRQCDVNRSSNCTSEDLVELMNLLNGAGGFNPMLGVTHPTCNIP